MTYYVYELWIVGEEREFYVGYTNNPDARKDMHIKDSTTREAHLRKGRKIAKALREGNLLELKPIFETEDMQEALDQEIALIKQRGRLDLGTGYLYNLTDGGDGHRGYRWSEDAKKRKSEAMKGDQRNKGRSRPDMREKMAEPIFVYNQDGSFLREYPAQKDAAEDLGVLKQSISKCLRGECNYTTGNGKAYQFSKTMVEPMPVILKTRLDPKPVKVYKQTEEHRRKLSESNKRAKRQ